MTLSNYAIRAWERSLLTRFPGIAAIIGIIGTISLISTVIQASGRKSRSSKPAVPARSWNYSHVIGSKGVQPGATGWTHTSNRFTGPAPGLQTGEECGTSLQPVTIIWAIQSVPAWRAGCERLGRAWESVGPKAQPFAQRRA